MRLWKTIVVIILLVIVGGYALYLGHQPAPEKTPKLFRVASKDIQKIELRSAARDVVVERGAGDSWKIIKPVETDADRVTVDSIADAISGLEISGTAEEKPPELAPFGLANPVVVVTVTTKDKRVLPEILVGKDTPVGNSAYIRTSDKPAILLVSNVFPTQVNKNVDDLRSRILMRLKPEDVSKIVLDHGNGPTVELERQQDKWTIVKPRPYPAENAAVQQMLDTISNAHVADFVEDEPTDLTKYGLANPSLKVEFYAKNNAEESILFGYKQPEASKNAVYIRRGEGKDRPVATVADNVLNEGNKGFNDLRDKTVLMFDPATVARVTLAGGPINEILERESGDKWKITADGKTAPAEAPVAKSLLDQLHDLKATKVAEDPMTDPKRYGMANPNLTMTLYAKDGKEIGAIRVSSVEATIIRNEDKEKPLKRYFGYAANNRERAVFEVAQQTVVDLENTASRLHTDALGTSSPSPSATPSSTVHPSPSANSPAPR